MAQRTAASIALGRAVHEFRNRRGLTQEQLALRSELQRKTVSELEGGLTDPRYGTLRRIATACEVRVVDILTLADELEARAGGVGASPSS